MVALFLDHNISYDWQFPLNRAGNDVTTARDQNLTAVADYDILRIAASRRWIVVTHNSKDFRLLHGAWLTWPGFFGLESGPPHPGILILPHGLRSLRAAETIQELLAIQSDLDNRLFVWHPDTSWTAYRAKRAK